MNNTERLSYLEPITNGAKVLTEHFGNESWKGKINPDTLMMSHPCRCILGQLFGDYWDGLREVFEVEPDSGAPWGFDVVFDEGVYIHLAEAWREYLKGEVKS